MRYYEERKMKRMPQWAWCNSMHEFRLLPSTMWYVFGCESEASDLTPDKSPCAAASECITERTAGAKSIFIWVQLMSLQLPTKVPPPRHQMWGFSSLCVHAGICVFACDCVHVSVCVYESKGESIYTRWLQGGIGLILPRAVCREITLLYGSAHTHWSCFDSGFWHSLTLISCLHGERQRRLHTPLPAGRTSGHFWWCHRTDRWRRTARPILPCVIPLADGRWRTSINPNVFILQTLSQLTGVRWILNILRPRYWDSFLSPANCCSFFYFFWFHLGLIALYNLSVLILTYQLVLYVSSTISGLLVALLYLSYCLMKLYSCHMHSHAFWLCAWPFLAPHGGYISIWSKLIRGLYIILMCNQGAVGYLNGGLQKRDAEHYWYYFITFTIRIKRNLQSCAKET